MVWSELLVKLQVFGEQLCSSCNRSAAHNQDGLLYSTHENDRGLDSTVTFLYLLANLADKTYDPDRTSFAASTGRHFFGVQFMTSLRCNLYPFLTRYDITHNNCINSHTQKTTACQFVVF
jgi:hypothetical protein